MFRFVCIVFFFGYAFFCVLYISLTRLSGIGHAWPTDKWPLQLALLCVGCMLRRSAVAHMMPTVSIRFGMLEDDKMNAYVWMTLSDAFYTRDDVSFE